MSLSKFTNLKVITGKLCFPLVDHQGNPTKTLLIKMMVPIHESDAKFYVVSSVESGILFTQLFVVGLPETSGPVEVYQNLSLFKETLESLLRTQNFEKVYMFADEDLNIRSPITIGYKDSDFYRELITNAVYTVVRERNTAG